MISRRKRKVHYLCYEDADNLNQIHELNIFYPLNENSLVLAYTKLQRSEICLEFSAENTLHTQRCLLYNDGEIYYKSRNQVEYYLFQL